MTEWRPIPGIPYLASSDGLIRHVESDRPRKPQANDRGYLYVSFWRNKRHSISTVHVLVAAAFLGPRPEGAQVCHIDGNPQNNAPSNLRYGTPKENAADRERHGNTRRGQRNGNSKLSDDDVGMIRALYAAKKANQHELAALFRASQAQVNNIVLFKQRRRAA